MIYRQILACLLLILLPLSAKAFPPASPAGGNYLVLDGVDDHAVLDFETFGILYRTARTSSPSKHGYIPPHRPTTGHVIDDTPSTVRI